MQVKTKSPDSHAISNKEFNGQQIAVSPGAKKQPLGNKSIKELAHQNQIIQELDVETNYLRSSVQNFGDEMHIKTVFQKRASKPADVGDSTPPNNVIKETVDEDAGTTEKKITNEQQNEEEKKEGI